jgi:hypothetical protein
MQPDERSRFAQTFTSLDSLIDNFRSTLFSLLPLSQTRTSSPLFGTVLLTHTLALSAIINLHSPFVNDDARSRSKSLSAAEECVELLRQVDMGNVEQVNPLFGCLWMGVCKVFIEAMGAGWAAPGSASSASHRQRDQNELADMLEKVFATMAVFSIDSPLMGKYLIRSTQFDSNFLAGYQLAKIQELYHDSRNRI